MQRRAKAILESSPERRKQRTSDNKEKVVLKSLDSHREIAR